MEEKTPKLLFIISLSLTGVSFIIDLCYSFIYYKMDDGLVLTLATIIFNKCLMWGSIYFTFDLLMKEYRGDAKDDKRYRIWLIISGIFYVVFAIVFQTDLIVRGEYIAINGFVWIGDGMMP